MVSLDHTNYVRHRSVLSATKLVCVILTAMQMFDFNLLTDKDKLLFIHLYLFLR